MPVIYFFAMNALVIWSALLLTCRFMRFTSFVDAALSVLLFFTAQVILTEQLLGIAGLLTARNLILCNLIVLLGLCLAARGRKPSCCLNGMRAKTREALDCKVVRFMLSLIAGFFAVKVFINLINPPKGWDAITYHLIFPVEWIKQASLTLPFMGHPTPAYYPVNGSLFFLWLMIPFRNVCFADAGQAPFFLIAFLSVFGIVRRLGCSRELSLYAAGLFILVPNFFKQAELAYVDAMFAALFLSCVYFLSALYEDFSWRNCILYSVSSGLFFGVKTSAAVYGVLPCLFFAFILLKRRGGFKPSRCVWFVLLFLFFTAVLGGFAYIRNYLQAGNPFYPAEVKIFGKQVWRGVMTFYDYRNRWTAKEYNIGKLLFGEGMGGQFLLFAVPGMFLSLPAVFLRRAARFSDARLFFVLSSPLLLYLAFYYCMPQLWVRYLYPCVGMSFAAAFLGLHFTRVPLKAVRAVVFMCAFASAAELARRGELAASLALSALFFCLSPFLARRLRFSVFSFGVFIAAALLAAQFLNADYERHEISRYSLVKPFAKDAREAWAWAEARIPLGSRIAYSGSFGILPLYGRHFKNDVLYVSVNKVHPVQLHYFPRSRYILTDDFLSTHKYLEKEGNYRENPDYNSWLRNLEAEKIGYVLVYALHEVRGKPFPLEDAWAAAHPETLRLVFANETVHIYEIIAKVSG